MAVEVATVVVVVVEASMVVVLAVAVVSMGEVSVAVSTVAFVVALWLPDTLEAESGAAVVESALAERTFQVGLQTFLA